MSDPIWFWMVMAMCASLGIWTFARVTIWLAARHWRHCPRNPDREWHGGFYIDAPTGIEITGNTFWWPPESGDRENS